MTGNASNNILSISAWTNCSTFAFGSMDMGSAGFVTSSGASNKPVDFTGSTVAYNHTTHMLTITLGTPVTGGSNGSLGTVTSSVATLTIDSGITNTTGTAVSPTTFATGNIKQF